MSKRILIDSTLENETRIALINNEDLEEYEIEKTDSQRIKSNIYLAKISRVEASLQAAFVDFGGNRHGFLPFTEIHPDYFKIPVSDQKKLKDIASIEQQDIDRDSESDQNSEEEVNNEKTNGESNGSNQVKDKLPDKKRLFSNFFRKYKIQEVIKPHQVILVQISKEERGLKGAALTTYLSLAGRYCVLMPNNNSNVGISRKIQDQSERKKLKDILESIGIPNGMSVIIRTAGVGKLKKEIGKDFDFLINQWNKIRDLTLKSNAPTLIYEEGNVIKRTIRDLYNKEISSITISGKTGYDIAKKYMKELLPTQTGKLKIHKDVKENLFSKYKLEKQIDELYKSNIKLSSGGSIVINSTEALVAIDVNSGKATQQRNIENTALNTNLEAATEIAKQLRLRDLAGLIVIDFIDMEDHRNNFKVEKCLRQATSTDRARIQIGRISPFGLLELSRQRLRTSFVEQSFIKCELCGGSGVIRNTNSLTEQLFKVLMEFCDTNRGKSISIKCNSKLADDILNKKKAAIIEMEKDFECKLVFEFNSHFLINEPQISILELSENKVNTLSKNEKQNKITKKKKSIKKRIKIRKGQAKT
ncbi:MAG: Ribonuclease E [Alphaproteobacteria bacterium MarineAlpha5_Bin11]|nr:ribonuclease E/G [Pelagibacteraceae bacterium]PPR42680.1 MAG: Ribonuclease E [Alphaproteobacteria bacterium MarineAlpha5_Bin11]PPR51576.1 MAG: Ribonuclease E [Alphaproteobacteria bacterium MarineAlpha5_Bin10]|tara:strand:- start:8466 stop:10229 length:1764 start_codon:yes stop_codon:yes gene_type:complete